MTWMLSWNVLGDVWSSYSVENPFVPASEERNSTMDATLGALKTRKAAVCRSVNFWWGTPVEVTSYKLSVSFKAHLRNLVKSLFLVALQTEYCKPATPFIKGDFLKFLESPFFGIYHARVRFFLTELQNLEASLTLLKYDSTTDAVPAILKFPRTNKGNTYRWVVGQLKFFKINAIKDIIL